MKPAIILYTNQNYEATQLHFDNLVKRYGNPIIILNQIKTREKKPRETILHAEYAKAIDHLNKNLLPDSRLRFLHWDLNKYSRRKSINVLALLGKVMDYAPDLTGFFYCQVPPALRRRSALTFPILLYMNACRGYVKESLLILSSGDLLAFRLHCLGNLHMFKLHSDVLVGAESSVFTSRLFEISKTKTIFSSSWLPEKKSKVTKKKPQKKRHHEEYEVEGDEYLVENLVLSSDGGESQDKV